MADNNPNKSIELLSSVIDSLAKQVAVVVKQNEEIKSQYSYIMQNIESLTNSSSKSGNSSSESQAAKDTPAHAETNRRLLLSEGSASDLSTINKFEYLKDLYTAEKQKFKTKHFTEEDRKILLAIDVDTEMEKLSKWKIPKKHKSLLQDFR